MAGGKRGQVKVTLQQAVDHIVQAQEYILREAEQYKIPHPAHYFSFHAILEVLEMSIDAIETLKENI
jgi:hypothetical protein